MVCIIMLCMLLQYVLCVLCVLCTLCVVRCKWYIVCCMLYAVMYRVMSDAVLDINLLLGGRA